MQTPEEARLEREAFEREQQQFAADALKSLLTRPAAKEQLYDSPGSPRVLIRVFDRDGLNSPKRYFCRVEADDVDPYRYTTAEERQLGILSLDPAAAQARTIGELIEASTRAFLAGVFATPAYADVIKAGDLAMIYYRTTRAIRHTLRLLGEDI